MPPRKVSRKSLRKPSRKGSKKDLKMPSTFCVICKRNFTSKNLLKQHNTKHHFFRHCPNCPKTFQRTRKYVYHLRSHLEDHPYECTRCLESFNQKRDLLAHKIEERSSKRFYCDTCHEVFPFLASLNRHRLAHSGPPYSCDECVATFRNVPDGTVHCKNHVHRCFMCPREIVAFSSHGDLVKHMVRVHQTESVPDESEAIEPCVSTGAVNLEDDGNSDSMDDLLSSSGLDSDSDEDNNHQEDAVEPVHKLRRKDKFICFICYELYPSGELLKSHMKDHNWYPCNSCPRFFANAETLEKHKCDFAQVPSSRCENCNSECENCKIGNNISEVNRSALQSIAPRFPEMDECEITDYTDAAKRNCLINYIHNIKSHQGSIDTKILCFVGFHNVSLNIILKHPGVNRLFPRECISDIEELYSKFQELSQMISVRIN